MKILGGKEEKGKVAEPNNTLQEKQQKIKASKAKRTRLVEKETKDGKASKKKNEDNTISFIPMQEFIVNRAFYEMEDKSDSKVDKLVQIPDDIQAQYKDIKFNQPRELVGFNDLGVYPINHSKTNKKFPDIDIPEAMFVDAVDNCLMVETSITDKAF